MTRIENLLQEFEKYYKNREFITRIGNLLQELRIYDKN